MKIFLSLLLLVCLSFPAFAADQAKESAYDRVMRTNTIRCAYYVWPPFLAKDPNTGEISGIASEMMNEIGAALNLKIEWTAEVNFDAMFEGYATGRYDMLCGPLIITPARARASDFTMPFIYVTYQMYVKEGDLRFENAYQKANAPDIRYANLDGDINEALGKEVFPQAQKISIGQNAASTDPLMMVMTGKADVTTLDPVVAQGFMKANPGEIRRVAGPPVRVMPMAYSVPIGEERFKAMLNISLLNIINTGFIDKVLADYPEYDATVLRVVPGYAMPESKQE